jgi:putative restriction endonuclease
MGRAWTLISISEGRQYGGNLGYEDDPSRVYRYDSSVPNHLRVAVGDLVLIRGRLAVIGMARIERLDFGQGIKTRLRCPVCGNSQIKARHTLSPRWRCVSGHLFENAAEQQISVTTYEAHYGNTFVKTGGAISVADLRRAAFRPSDQLSIEELNPLKLVDQINAAGSQATAMFARFLQAMGPESSDGWEIEEPHYQEQGGRYVPSFADTRVTINRAIALRRGQGAFRKKLVRRYGPTCMITGCDLFEIVEAAHIWPYRGERDNHPENGRTDLHTLFDLDLLGINPGSLKTCVHPSALTAGYAELEDLPLRASSLSAPSHEALETRWHSFLERLKRP